MRCVNFPIRTALGPRETMAQALSFLRALKLCPSVGCIISIDGVSSVSRDTLDFRITFVIGELNEPIANGPLDPNPIY